MSASPEKRDTYYDVLPTPAGDLLAHVDGRGRLRALEFLAPGADPAATLARSLASGETPRRSAERTAAVRAELEEYFAGRRRDFTLELAPRGSDFQQRVWEAMRAIPYGETRTYGELARGLGRPGGARAVGRASATNPIPIVVPCHRVVGSDGSLTGYGGGLERKRALLELEGHAPDKDRQLRLSL